jgi:hypothetical protein
MLHGLEAHATRDNAHRDAVSVIGAWDLELVWNLGFGIWNFPAGALWV